MRRFPLLTLLIPLLLTGCGGNDGGYPLRGKVVLADGDIKQLAEAHVEFQLEGDPTVRGDGQLSPDGAFEVQSLHQGKLRRGLPPGQYRARILFEDDGKDPAKRRNLAVRPKYVDFRTSGLSVTVPSAEDVILTVSRK